MLVGLPEARGYDVVVKPLRYREKPHLAAMTDFLGRGSAGSGRSSRSQV